MAPPLLLLPVTNLPGGASRINRRNGTLLASADDNGQVIVWSMDPDRMQVHMLSVLSTVPGGLQLQGLSFSPDGRQVKLCAKYGMSVCERTLDDPSMLGASVCMLRIAADTCIFVSQLRTKGDYILNPFSFILFPFSFLRQALVCGHL